MNEQNEIDRQETEKTGGHIHNGASQVTGCFDDTLRQHPYTGLIISFGAGLLAGLLVYQGCSCIKK